MNSNLLKGKLAENSLTFEKVSKILNISPLCFSRKINGKSDFKVIEVKALQELLKLTDEETTKIFLK